MKFTVALLQIAPFGNDQSRNLAKGLQYCGEAKALGADLAVFPELWNIGFARSPIDFEARQLWAGSAIDQRSAFFQSFEGRFEVGAGAATSGALPIVERRLLG